MPTTLTFQLDGLRRLVEHAEAAPQHAAAYQKPSAETPAGLWLVKDQGIYLMSNGYPQLPIGENTVYADGYGSDADWHAVQDAAGGDDVCEDIPLAWAKYALDHNQPLRIRVTATSMRLVTSRPRRS